MSVDLAVVGLEFQQTGGEAVASTLSSVASAADKTTASYARTVQGAAALSQSQFDLTKGYTGGMAARDAYFAQLDAEVSYMNKLSESRAIGIAEIQAYAEAEQRAAAATDEVTAATGNAFGGTSRLIRSMDSLAFSTIGVHGPMSSIATSLGLLGAGGGIMLPVAAGAAAIAVGFELVTKDAQETQKKVDDLTDSLNKSGQAFWAQQHPMDQLADEMKKLTAEMDRLQKAAAAPASVGGWLAGLIGFATGGYAGVGTAVANYYGKINDAIKANGDAQGEADRKAKADQQELDDKAIAAAQKKLQDIQAIADANGAMRIAQLNADGEDLAAAELQYSLSVQKDAAEAHIASLARDANTQLIAAKQLEADTLALLKFQSAEKEQQKKDNDALYKQMQAQVMLTRTIIATGPNGSTIVDSEGTTNAGQLAQQALLDKGLANITPISIHAAKDNADQVSAIYRQLANEVGRTFEQTFEGIFNGSITSLSQVVDQFTKMFETMLADLAAKAIQADLFGDLTKKTGDMSGVTADGSDSSTVASGLFSGGTLTSGLELGGFALVTSAVSSMLSSILDDGQAAAIAAAKIATAQASFAISLKSWVDSMEGATDAAAADANAANILAEQQQAITTAGGSATRGITTGGPRNPGRISADDLTSDSNQQLEVLRAYLEANDALTPAYKILIDQLEQINTASGDAATNLAKAAAATKAAFITSIDQNYLASLGDVGTELNALSKLAADTATALAQATQDGLAPYASQKINDTYENNAKALLSGLTTAQLDTLIPSLTGDVLAWAQAIDVTDHATDDAAASVKQLADAATLLATITTFLTGVQTNFTASLGAVGTELNSLTDLATKRASDLATAASLNLGPDQTSTTDGLIDATYANNVKAFLTSLSTSDLDTLLPSLTGDVYNWADAIDLMKHATDAATQSALDLAAAQKEQSAVADLQVRDLNATGNTGAGSVLDLLNKQAAERIADATFSPTDMALLLKTQSDEYNQLIATNQANAQSAFDSANASGGATTTSSVSSPTSFDMSVGTSEATSNRIAGLMTSWLTVGQQQLAMQTYLPKMFIVLGRMESLLGGIGKGSLDPALLDTGMATLLAGGNAAAGIPPGNR
jgi:hypothetical protein